MKKRLSLILFLSILLTSCTGVDPKMWNDNVVSVYTKTADEIEEFEELISSETIGHTAVNRTITEKATQVILEIDKSVSYIEQNEIPADAEQYQQILVSVLKTAKKQIEIGLQFTKLSEKTTEQEIEEYADRYDNASKQTAFKVDSLITIQAEFIKKEKLDEIKK